VDDEDGSTMLSQKLGREEDSYANSNALDDLSSSKASHHLYKSKVQPQPIVLSF
jgi:hypothetical protein